MSEPAPSMEGVMWSDQRASIVALQQEQSRDAARRTRQHSDEEKLAQCVAEAGLNAFGCVFVEMWAMTSDGTRLNRPAGGHWMDPSFAGSLPSEDFIDKAWELDRIAEDCPPGADLAGTVAEETNAGTRYVHWRQIRGMLADPFIQKGTSRRMERIFELGIGYVAAVPFSFQDHSGLVLYYSRSTADHEQLRAAANEKYLMSSTDVIGAVFAVRKAREECARRRKAMFKGAMTKVRKELLSSKQLGIAGIVMDQGVMTKLKELQAKEIAEMEKADGCCAVLAKKAFKVGQYAVKRVINSPRKWSGAKLHAMPQQSFSDCLFAFTGAFLTMLTILKVAKAFQADEKFGFNGGWYSSTLCITYALTPAPVGQPRQIFAAHLWNMLVGMAIRLIPDGDVYDFMEGLGNGLPMMWKLSLACALGLSGQAYLGIIHPPATGLSMVFTSNSHLSWGTVAYVMLTDVILVAVSVLLANLSEKKQYPMFWLGLGWAGSGGTTGYIRKSVRKVQRGTLQLKDKVQTSYGTLGEAIRKSVRKPNQRPDWESSEQTPLSSGTNVKSDDLVV